jgi:hypothetical protein
VLPFVFLLLDAPRGHVVAQARHQRAVPSKNPTLMDIAKR